MLTLLIGTDWIENRNQLLDMIAQDVAAERNGTVLIVPELISHDTERRLCEIAGNTACRFAEVLSFSRLAQRVSEYAGHGLGACMDNGGRIVAVASAARQLHGTLKAYASVETRPEFLTGLIEAIDEFKRCCISPVDLLNASRQSEGALAQKLEELSLLYEAYDAIAQRGKRDPRDQMTWLLEQLEACDFALKRKFYIDGFPDFTRQHMAIIEHLITSSMDVVISLNCDEINSGAPEFEKAGFTAAQIIRYAKDKGVTIRVQTVTARNDALSQVRACLFSGKPVEQPQLKNKLFVYRTKSVYDECVAAADRIMQLIQSGARYNQIGIVCADIGIYKNALQMILDRCEIPSYLSGTEEVLDKSVIVTVLSAIDAAVGGFEQADVIRYMKSALSPVDISICDKLENYAIMWNIRGRRWKENWTNHPAGLKEKWTEHDIKLLATLNQYRSRIIDPLSELQQAFQAATTVQQQVLALNRFLDEIRFAQRLSDLAHKMDEFGDNRNAQILNQLWEILLSALEQLYDILGDTTWDSEVFVRLLRLLLSQYNVGTIPPMLDAVTIGPVSSMRCQQVKHLILLGAVEGALPGYGGSGGVLSDRERTLLRHLGLPLTGGAIEGVQAEFAEIYGVFCGAEESVAVSMPNGQPSVVYRRLLALIGEEYAVDTELGTAFGSRLEAGALLVRYADENSAANLKIEESYKEVFAKSQYTLGVIEKETIRKLYGEKMNLSASQVDRQALCRFAYFLRYGLQVKERKVLTVDPAEFGTYVHAVLEETAKEVMTLGGFHEVSLDLTLAIANKHAEAYAQNHFNQLDSERLAYFFKRNTMELEFVVKELWEELQASEFFPVGFEVGFGGDGEIGAIQIPGHDWDAQLRGFVDRVDTWFDGSKQYFRVVDYKTGKKDFDYCDVFNGIGLQMLLYMFALEDDGKNLVEGTPVAAGVQYFPARAPYILVDGIQDVEAIMDLRTKEWKRKGLLLRDPDVLNAMASNGDAARLCATVKKDGTVSGDAADAAQLKMLRTYVFALLGKMVDEIASGCIEPNPYTRGSNDNACRYCPYGTICHPANIDGRRNYKALTAKRFWEDVERAVSVNG